MRGISSIAQWLAYLLANPADPGSIPSFPPKHSEEKIIYFADVNWLEENVPWLENVDETRLGTSQYYKKLPLMPQTRDSRLR